MAKSKYDNYTHAQLIDELKKLNKRKKYGLVWEEDKIKEKFEAETEGKLPVLTEDKRREIKTDQKKPTNILIEGDNFHSLSVLNYTHAKSIDVIYIDPPFNTGARNWKYNNDFVDNEDAYRHSKFINFLNNRFKLAQKLLSGKGIIICAIDDYEVHNVRHLMDSLFR
jgi:adenine-specific DNA-methyltransferase